jgi:hypothetical protein
MLIHSLTYTLCLSYGNGGRGGRQNLADTLVFALPELTVSNEAAKMALMARLDARLHRSLQTETNQ